MDNLPPPTDQGEERQRFVDLMTKRLGHSGLLSVQTVWWEGDGLVAVGAGWAELHSSESGSRLQPYLVGLMSRVTRYHPNTHHYSLIVTDEYHEVTGVHIGSDEDYNRDGYSPGAYRNTYDLLRNLRLDSVSTRKFIHYMEHHASPTRKRRLGTQEITTRTIPKVGILMEQAAQVVRRTRPDSSGPS